MRIRLDKYLADAGMGTRSEAKKFIAAGRVSVNGAVVRDPGCKVSEEDPVSMNGRPVRYAAFEYYLLNKPQGVISATHDEARGAVCVTDLIEDGIRKDLFPVGRLDKDTEGLLLITNDGNLCHRLLSPKNHVDKTYYVELDGLLTEDMIRVLEEGVDIGDDAFTRPCRIEWPISMQCRGESSALSGADACCITIHEGRYHQIKRMFKMQGRNVIFLKRLSMGPLTLDNTLAPGQYRRLTQEELAALKTAAGR